MIKRFLEVIIFKKLAHGFYFVIPTCLHQARTIDYRRLSSRLGQIDGHDFQKIKEAFAKLYL
ncbi:MAG: hypothetical protein HYT46_00770 [Candidatus Vogelbacteria bacterium]|nr:hypothetical protein [Candidatus Vogelbacteria bacterium]